MELPSNPLFTLADAAEINPMISPPVLQEVLNEKVKLGEIHKYGKAKLGGNKSKVVYGHLPPEKLNKVHLDMIELVDNHLTEPQKIFLSSSFQKETLKEVIKLTNIRYQKIKTVLKDARTALLSDIYSTLLGTAFKEVIERKFRITVVVSATDNRKSDLYFPHVNLKVEIKATSGCCSWMGGKYSKRPYPTLLVSYDVTFQKYFIALVPKIKWPPPSSDSFYAPILTWTDVHNDYPEKIILLGDDLNGKMIRHSL